jgi:xylan 1,4-beta-xylosidase
MQIGINLAAETLPFPHVWERCVGSCHAATALRADWQAQLARCRRELGFERVRFHGLLDDDMSALLGTFEQPQYSFHNIDLIFDYLLSLGMSPVIELSFMPAALASGPETVFHYRGNITPPRSYSAWGALVEALARHLIQRYGLEQVRRWPFEVWNEPNLPDFWHGTQAEYFELYRHTALALKKVDDSLQVGGPATARNAWLTDLRQFCTATTTPLDFLSTHHYPTDAALDLGIPWSEMEQMMARAERDTLQKMAAIARQEAGTLPLYYTEWSSSPSSRDRYHDEPYAAAFIIHNTLAVSPLVEMYSYWTFSDIFEENGQPSEPFHGGFGLLSLDGLSKPAYRAFEFLHRLSDVRIPVETHHPTLGLVAAPLSREPGFGILLYNHAVPQAKIHTEKVDITLSGLPAGDWRATLERVNETHANPKALWQKMGSPAYPTQGQIQQLEAESRLRNEPLRAEPASSCALRLSFEIPPHAVAFVTLSPERK